MLRHKTQILKQVKEKHCVYKSSVCICGKQRMKKEMRRKKERIGKSVKKWK